MQSFKIMCLIAVYTYYGMAGREGYMWCVRVAIHMFGLLSVLQAVFRTGYWWSTCSQSGVPINASSKAKVILVPVCFCTSNISILCLPNVEFAYSIPHYKIQHSVHDFVISK